MATYMKFEIYHEGFDVPLTVSQFEEAPEHGVVISAPPGQSVWQEFECVMLPDTARELGEALIAIATHCKSQQ